MSREARTQKVRSDCLPVKNKPNGQFHLPFEREAITAFMHDLPIRKIPGIGRVNERMLDSIGIKACLYLIPLLITF